MNRLTGTITQIESSEDISLVSIAAYGGHYAALVIDTPETASYLRPGNTISMIFKETEMAIGKNLTGGLSLRNNFPGTISQLEFGKILTSIWLDFQGQELCAIITTASATALQLGVGDYVVGLVKSNEVSLMQLPN